MRRNSWMGAWRQVLLKPQDSPQSWTTTALYVQQVYVQILNVYRIYVHDLNVYIINVHHLNKCRTPPGSLWTLRYPSLPPCRSRIMNSSRQARSLRLLSLRLSAPRPMRLMLRGRLQG